MSDEQGAPSRFLTLLPFEADHLALIDGVEPFVAGLALGDELTPGGAVTLVSEAGVLGCGGLVATGGDTAEAWAVVSPALRVRPMVLHRLAWRGLADAPFARIGATVRRGFTSGEQWLVRLGFRRVGRIRTATPIPWAGDYVRYERCHNWRC